MLDGSSSRWLPPHFLQVCAQVSQCQEAFPILCQMVTCPLDTTSLCVTSCVWHTWFHTFLALVESSGTVSLDCRAYCSEIATQLPASSPQAGGGWRMLQAANPHLSQCLPRALRQKRHRGSCTERAWRGAEEAGWLLFTLCPSRPGTGLLSPGCRFSAPPHTLPPVRGRTRLWTQTAWVCEGPEVIAVRVRNGLDVLSVLDKPRGSRGDTKTEGGRKLKSPKGVTGGLGPTDPPHRLPLGLSWNQSLPTPLVGLFILHLSVLHSPKGGTG